MMLADRYRLQTPLGHGGMGEVWQAWDRRLGRPVAVKLLTASADGDEALAERFDAEARTAARLNDPRVVAIYDIGVCDGRRFLVMELVKGTDLAEELREHGPLSCARAAEVAAQAAEGLAAAHRRGVVHRDVKPANLLLARDGTVKIADFGIARWRTEDTVVLKAGAAPDPAPHPDPDAGPACGPDGGDGDVVIAGTGLYLAPEVALGGSAGTAGDVYSLGCTLYELLTGRPPFVAEHPIAVLRHHVETAPVPLRRLRPGIPEGFEAYVLRMLAKAPQDRPGADEVAEWFADGAWRPGGTQPGAAAAPDAETEVVATVGEGDLVATTAIMPAVVLDAPAPRSAPAFRRRRVTVAAATAGAALVAAVLVIASPLTHDDSGTPVAVPPGSHSPAPATPSPATPAAHAGTGSRRLAGGTAHGNGNAANASTDDHAEHGVTGNGGGHGKGRGPGGGKGKR